MFIKTVQDESTANSKAHTSSNGRAIRIKLQKRKKYATVNATAKPNAASNFPTATPPAAPSTKTAMSKIDNRIPGSNVFFFFIGKTQMK